MTGISSLSIKMASYIEQGQIQGFGTAMLTIGICMVIFLGSFRIGILSMLPNLFPIVVVLGTMGWLGIKLDYVKMLISSISLGIIVDDSIHFFSRFQKNFTKFGRLREALESTFVETGKPMLAISVILIIGFLVNLFSAMDSLRMYGLLSAYTILVAFFSDIFLGSALLVLTFRSREGVSDMGRKGISEGMLGGWRA
jgi:predicted RND superfamily exporter protein